MDLNRATILGRLTRDPEVRTTSSGRSVATLGVATNRVWKDQTGAEQKYVEYHNCVLWGKLADIAGQYLTKGRRLYVEGRLQTRDWVGTDGVKRFRTEIVASTMIMLDGPRGTGSASAAPSFSDGAPVPGEEDNIGNDAAEEEVKVEDIPF